MQTYQNPTEAFVESLRIIRRDSGNPLTVRGSAVREVLQHGFTIKDPLQRFIIPRGRNGNPFSTVAETIWVLSGRDDVQFLDAYMPKAAYCYSDDGKTWRAAYGPRLRHWPGGIKHDIDQIKAVVQLLRKDPNTRRATITLFDPTRDFVDSKDIPCNNWIHIIARNGKLHMSVAVRSNDIWFGFSGINLFEWSVLQEAFAYWTGNGVGNYSVLIGSLHLYEQHERAAGQVLDRWQAGKTMYDLGVRHTTFDVPFDTLDHSLSLWFELEDEAKRGDWEHAMSRAVQLSPFLKGALSLSSIWFCAKRGDTASIARILGAMEETDFKAAAAEWLVRHNKIEHTNPVLYGPIANFLACSFASNGRP